MISYREAQQQIAQNIPAPIEERVSALAALGCVVSRDVCSPLSLPIFDNSAMDGFVLRSEDTETATPERPVRLKISDVIRAGDTRPIRWVSGEAHRILTGAPVPVDADTVLPTEKSEVIKDMLIVRAPLAPGRHIRAQAEEIQKGQCVIPKGSVVHPATVGILASLGTLKVWVYRKPRVSLVATGTELVEPGKPLSRGKIYDSNSSMIKAALLEMRLHPVFTKRLADQPKNIKEALRHALPASDVVILTGGVSTGSTDFVRPILEELSVQTIFWKVSQKPGKPIYLGRRGQTLVFGLPGNPAAVFTCFYEYVYPAVRRFMGYARPYLASQEIPVDESIEADPEKSLFLKVKVERRDGASIVTPLYGQASHMISSLQEATGLLVVPSGRSVEKGEKVLVHSLPYRGESGDEN